MIKEIPDRDVRFGFMYTITKVLEEYEQIQNEVEDVLEAHGQAMSSKGLKTVLKVSSSSHQSSF